MLAGDDFGDGNAFVLGLMRQHRPAHDIADGVDARHVGSEMLVDDDAATLRRDAGSLKSQPRDERTPANRDEDNVRVADDLVAAVCRSDRDLDPGCRLVGFGDLVAEQKFEALFFEHALELPSDFAIHRSEDVIEEFDDENFCTEPAPDRAQFEADDARADDDDLARNFAK